MAMILLVTLLAPRLANAFCIYNSKGSDRTVMIAQLEIGNDFKKTHSIWRRSRMAGLGGSWPR
jgi:hypothetical protein